jgi:arabinogalactan oligomer/maltooligosaccharide transport system substrate-binding protein
VNFGIAKLPTIGGVQPICFSGVIIAAMSSYTRNPDIAYTWLDFLAGPEGATILYREAGKLPALADQSLIPGLSEDPLLQGILKQTPYTIPMPAIPEMSQGWAGLAELFTHTWDGTLTPEQAQDKAMETYKDLLLAADRDINF